MRRLFVFTAIFGALPLATLPATAAPPVNEQITNPVSRVNPDSQLHTRVNVRVLARGAKFIGGYADSVRVVLTDADTGEVLAQGLTQGTTGDTQRILAGTGDGKVISTEDSAVFRASLATDRARRVTATVTGPLSQPQAATTVTSTQWILPGHDLTQGDGWVLELPGLVVDLVSPSAFRWADRNSMVPVDAAVTMMCGCALTENGPWRADETTVSYQVTVNGAPRPPKEMTFDAKTGQYRGVMVPKEPGIHEIEVHAWDGKHGNAGVGRTTVFVK